MTFDLPLAIGGLLVGTVGGLTGMGAQASSRAPGGIIRRVLAVLLLASSMKLLGFSNEATLLVAAGALVLGSLFWFVIRRQARASRQRAVAAHRAKTAPLQSPAPPGGPAAGQPAGEDEPPLRDPVGVAAGDEGTG